MRWWQLKNQMRKYPPTNGIKKANGKRRTQIRIQITINITENKRTCMMGLSLLLLKPNWIEINKNVKKLNTFFRICSS